MNVPALRGIMPSSIRPQTNERGTAPRSDRSPGLAVTRFTAGINPSAVIAATTGVSGRRASGSPDVGELGPVYLSDFASSSDDQVASATGLITEQELGRELLGSSA